MKASKKLIGVIALAIMTAAVSAAAIMGTGTQTVMAAPNEQPGISVPFCESNGIFMYWHTENGGRADAPDGWRVERRHWVGGPDNLADNIEDGFKTKTWEFIGTDADALQVYSDKYWDWKDRSRSRNVSYTYRVRAINSDSTNMAGRDWSRRAPVRC